MNEWIQTLLQHTSYFGVFGVLLVCGLGLPLPEDIPLLFGGYLAHRGLARIELMILVALVGVLCGDCILFGLGRKYGEAILERPLLRRFVTPARLDWAERRFIRHGKKIIFAARFMPGARGLFFATAGIFRVRPLTFLLIDGFAALISVPVWVWAGYKFGMEAHEHLGGAQAKYLVFGALGVILAAWVVWEMHQKRKHQREEIEYAAHPHRLHGPAPTTPQAKSARPAPRSVAGAPTVRDVTSTP